MAQPGTAGASTRRPSTAGMILRMLTGPFPGDGARGVADGHGDERDVIHALRDSGWYVADDVSIGGVDIDHVAVGPAGVLAVQVMWTNRPDPRGKAAVRARIAAGRLRGVLAASEVNVEVVPAVLAFGPGLTDEPAGVKVVDSVAILFGDQSDRWVAELSRRALLGDDIVEAVRSTVGDLREDKALVDCR